MAQIEAGVLDSLDHFAQHLDPRATAVAVSHVAAGPPEQTVNDFSGGSGTSEGIGRIVAQRVKRLPVALGSDAGKPSIGPTLEVA